MTSAVYLEHYLDSLEHLPVELQRNFTLMRELDTRAQTVMRNIDRLADDYMSNVKNLGNDKRKESLSDIQQQFNKAKEYGDDKVQLAIQTYELVDKHIRRLDSDLARFESEIHDKVSSSARSDDPTISGSKKGRKKAKDKEKKRKGSGSDEESGGKGVKKRKKTGGKAVGGKNPGGKATNTVSSVESPLAVLPLAGGDVLDMPVDPNEPTYCLCHQVSYGEMIGCDNPDCPIEWFHFACVNLTTKPKGKWFCPKCSSDRKKK